MSEYVAFHTDADTLYIDLIGRVDTTNASEVEADIQAIRDEHPGMALVIDADRLDYISSAGLRVIMRLLKQEPKLSMINVAPEVYQVFEMTGFSEMMNIEETYPRLSIEGCEFLAKGGNGAVYRYDPETIVKVYYNPDALPEIEQERKNARKAFVMGINTAIPYGIVRIGDGYGSLTELLSAKSISKMIIADPEHLDEPVRYFVDLVKQMHATEVAPGELPDLNEQVLGWADFVKDELAPENATKLHTLVAELPDTHRLIHGDYHTNNVMLQDGEPLLIDLDTLSIGHPILEFGSMYNAFVGFGDLDHKIVEDFLGYSFETAGRFWRLSLEYYLGTSDQAAVQAMEDKAKVIGYTRLLRRAMRRNHPNREALIANYKQQLEDALSRVDTLDF